MTSPEDRKKIEDNAEAYMIFGDVDKPFHRPECECDACEEWRSLQNRPTHRELRNAASQQGVSNDGNQNTDDSQRDGEHT